MRRRAISVVFSAVTILGMAVAAPAPAAAAGNRCPDSFAPVATSVYGEAGEAIDKNHDGMLCDKPAMPAGSGEFIVIDNRSAKP